MLGALCIKIVQPNHGNEQGVHVDFQSPSFVIRPRPSILETAAWSLVNGTPERPSSLRTLRSWSAFDSMLKWRLRLSGEKRCTGVGSPPHPPTPSLPEKENLDRVTFTEKQHSHPVTQEPTEHLIKFSFLMLDALNGI